MQTLLRKPAETEVIITGRCKNQPAYFDLASIHSEMVCHKHYATRRRPQAWRGLLGIFTSLKSLYSAALNTPKDDRLREIDILNKQAVDLKRAVDD
jgi:hypothetical protein